MYIHEYINMYEIPNTGSSNKKNEWEGKEREGEKKETPQLF